MKKLIFALSLICVLGWASAEATTDAGTTLVEVPTDKDGTVRPVGLAYDIGAYEWQPLR